MDRVLSQSLTFFLFIYFFFYSERRLQSLQFDLWEEEHDGHGDDEWLGACVQARSVPAHGELADARPRAVAGQAAARGPAQLGALGSQVSSRFYQFVSLAPPRCHGVTKSLPGRQGWYSQSSDPHTVIWHATLKASATFISTAFPLMKYLQSSHTATSLVFAFKAVMWKFGLWFWYTQCSWICYEQNLYLNICYKLIIWKHRTPLFFCCCYKFNITRF